eukprot:1159110-Pelagomonas_calceolata.AAC.1
MSTGTKGHLRTLTVLFILCCLPLQQQFFLLDLRSKPEMTARAQLCTPEPPVALPALLHDCVVMEKYTRNARFCLTCSHSSSTWYVRDAHFSLLCSHGEVHAQCSVLPYLQLRQQDHPSATEPLHQVPVCPARWQLCARALGCGHQE